MEDQGATGPGRRLRWPFWLVGADIAFALAVTAAAALRCAADDQAGLPCLGELRPVFAKVIALGHSLLVFGIRPSWVPALSVAAAIVSFAVARRREPDRESAAGTARAWPLGLEAGALALLTLVIVVDRFYLLNRIPSDTIGDVSFSMLATSDWHSLTTNNIFGGAPLGLLYFLTIAGPCRIFGASFLTMRFVSALTGVLLTQTLYGFTRTLGGPLAAVIAAALYAFSPVEMVWGRHDMFPFSASPLVILLALSTYLALTRFSLRYWIACALLMGASYHLFASGLAAFAIPIGAVLWTALFDRQRLRRAGARVAFIGVGLGLWLAGRSFAVYLATDRWQWLGPFDPRLSSRVARGGEALQGFAENLREIVAQVYVGSRGDVHQTPISVFGAPGAWVTPLVAILFSAGAARCLARRTDPASGVLLSLLAAGALPGIVSVAAAHRAAALFPAITALAALTAAALLERLEHRLGALGWSLKVALTWSVLSAAFLTTAGIYFGQRTAEPPSVVMAKAVRPFLKPDALVVFDMPLGLQIDVNFLLFDDLVRDDSATVWTDTARLPTLLRDPKPDFHNDYYRETVLRRRVDEMRAKRWKHLVFVVHEAMDREHTLELLRATFEDAKVTDVSPPTWRPGYAFTAVEVERP